jgi:hypothetical protein
MGGEDIDGSEGDDKCIYTGWTILEGVYRELADCGVVIAVLGVACRGLRQLIRAHSILDMMCCDGTIWNGVNPLSLQEVSIR